MQTSLKEINKKNLKLKNNCHSSLDLNQACEELIEMIQKNSNVSPHQITIESTTTMESLRSYNSHKKGKNRKDLYRRKNKWSVG
jgi:hypothetical protein